MKYLLLATDLDGTLLNEEREIDVETVKAIQEYRERGGKVVICSGRSPLSTRWIAQTIGLKGEPIIAYNGAIILDGNGEVREQAVFQDDSLLGFWELCEVEGIYAHFYEGDTLLVPERNKWNVNWIENNILPLAKTGGKPRDCESFRDKCKVKVVDNFYQYIKNNQPKISKIAVFDETKSLLDFSKVIENRVGKMEISSSLNYLNLEISPIGVTKGSALLKLTEHKDIRLSQTAAIGDNFNDMKMLSLAGLGIAMGNAPEQVKRLADQVTKNYGEAGAAHAIRRYLLE